MSRYIPHQVTLTESQKHNLSQAFKTKTPITLRLTFSQLQNGSDTVGLTKTQIKQIEKHKAEKIGIVLTLSPSQVSKQGGFLGSLLLNVAKSVLPRVGISALEGLTSGLVNKIISGNGCDYNEFVIKLLPDLLKDFPTDKIKTMKEGGFIIPLLATLASTLVPTIVKLLSGKGYQVRPPTGIGYQVRPPKNYLTTL